MTSGDHGALTFVEYARRIGTSRPYVSKLVKLGYIHGPALTPDRKIIPDVADRQRAEMSTASRTRFASAEASDDATYASQRARKTAADADRAELELAARRGALVDREAVTRAVEDAFVTVRERIISAARDAVPELIRLSGEQDLERHLVAVLRGAMTKIHLEFGGASGE